jgi:putative nucleotidyltransferase with HDIG domain
MREKSPAPRLFDRMVKSPIFVWGMRLLSIGLMAPLLLAAAPWPPDWSDWAAALMLPVVAAFAIWAHLRRADNGGLCPAAAERLVWLTSLLSIGGQVLLLRLVPEVAMGTAGPLLAAPPMAQALLLASLLGPGTAVTGMTMSLMLGLASGAVGAPMAGAAWLAAFAGAHLAATLKKRSDLVRALALVCAVLVLAAASQRAIVGPALPSLSAWGEFALWGLVAGIGSVAIYWLGVTVLERLSGAVSDWTLLELSNSDHPLLHRLAMQAPGTYAHSVMVANLSEGAARAIGANPTLCRAMAMFHDIGKMERPYCFVENQSPGDNIHDTLAPHSSAKLVIEHVSHGAEMGRKAGLPKIILDGIQQHHGTSVIQYFYHRARTADRSAREEDFRYPGPKPQSREAAILHLADQVEAACRTLRDPEDTPEFIQTLIRRSLEDGQLSESPLTLKDLSEIGHAMSRSLLAARHHRVEYPSLKKDDAAGSLDSARLWPSIEADAGAPSRDRDA